MTKSREEIRREACEEIQKGIRPPDGKGATLALAAHFGVSHQAIGKWWKHGIPGAHALEVADLSGVDVRRVFDAVRGETAARRDRSAA